MVCDHHEWRARKDGQDERWIAYGLTPLHLLALYLVGRVFGSVHCLADRCVPHLTVVPEHN